METVELIIKIALFILNVSTVAFIVIMIGKWHKRMEDKLDEIKEYTRRVSDRNDVVLLNQLQWIKCKLIEEERYEEADKINKCIEEEFKRINKYEQH